MSAYQNEFHLKGIKPSRNPVNENRAVDTGAASRDQRPGGVVHQLVGDGVKREKECTCFNLLTWIFQQRSSAELMRDVYPAVMAQKIPCPLMCVCKSAAMSRARGHRYEWEIERGLPLFEEALA